MESTAYTASNNIQEENTSNIKSNEDSTEDLVVEVDVSVYELDRPKEKKENCSQYINMEKLYSNSDPNYKEELIAARQVITPICACTKRCNSRLTEAEKYAVLYNFIKMDKLLQNKYLRSLLVLKPVMKRKNIKTDNRRYEKLRMFLSHYMIRTESKEFSVCKTAFCNLFLISKTRIDKIAQKFANKRPELYMDVPKKVIISRKKLSVEVLDKVMEHIRTFPYTYPHLEDKDSHLESNGIRDLHVRTMYMMYLKKYHPISYDLLSRGMQAFPEVSYECYYQCVLNFNSYYFKTFAELDDDDDFDDDSDNSNESTNLFKK